MRLFSIFASSSSKRERASVGLMVAINSPSETRLPSSTKKPEMVPITGACTFLFWPDAINRPEPVVTKSSLVKLAQITKVAKIIVISMITK